MRRRYVRHPASIPIDIRVLSVVSQDRELSCMTTVSQGGMSCELDFSVTVGSKININIASVSPPYEGVGEVVWCHERNKHFVLGVQFSDEKEAFKSRMVQQVCQIEEYKNNVLTREGRLLDTNQAAAEWIAKNASSFPH